MLMDEPSVLDLVRAIFKDWKSFFHFAAAIFDPSRRAGLPYLSETYTPPKPEPEPAAEVELEAPASGEAYPAGSPASVLPWRSLLALLLALLAQRTFEPPHLSSLAGIVFYLAALGLLLWAVRVGEWILAPVPSSRLRADPLTVRLVPLLLALLLTGAAFLDFNDFIFTWHNLLLWLAAVAMFCLALWLPGRRLPARRKLDWGWIGLLAVGLGLVFFFRFYRLEAVPVEPFSDHAEKLMDVYDISQGKAYTFFTRNTGREGFQMYWTWLVMKIFGTGFTFLSLKLGTALLGFLTVPYMYLLGKEVGGRRVGLLAMFLFGIAYWPNVISRVGLRFPLYPLFTAPVLYYLLRGLRTQNRNDFILSGLFLGLGLHGYSPFRAVPLLVAAALGIYLLHRHSKLARFQAQLWLVVTAMTSLLAFLPLLRYMLEHPDSFWYRTATRLGSVEQNIPGPAWQVFLRNLWNGLRMFNWDNGGIWVNSIMNRPALDVLCGALFLIGVVLLMVRYIRQRHWLDLFLLLSILVLQLPSTLSLAYPDENPALNRAGGAAVPVFLVAALALDGLLSGLQARLNRRWGAAVTWGLAVSLLAWSSWLNYDLVFNQYAEQYRQGAWNTSDIGRAIGEFTLTRHSSNAWVVPAMHWVDTRLPGAWLGIPNRDFALWPDQFQSTLDVPGPKFFIVRAGETEVMTTLQSLYPQGTWKVYVNDIPGHEFWSLTVP